MPLEWAIAVAAQTASVLAAAHAVSLVHRDLKPSNVMIKPDGTVTVLDFGVAAVLEADITRLTATGEAVGSPACMSPEPFSAVFPVHAVTCTHSVASRMNFSPVNGLSLRKARIRPCASTSRKHRPGYGHNVGTPPSAIEELVLQLLAKEPENRPADAQEVYERLLPFLPQPGSGTAEAATAASDPTRPYRRPLAPRRRAVSQRAQRVSPATLDIRTVRDEAADLAEAGDTDRAHRGARLQLANTLLLGGDYARALVHYERLVAQVAPERPADDSDVLHWRMQIVVCHAALGRAAQALEQLEPVLAMRLRQHNATDDEVVELRQQAANLRASAGDIAGAASQVRSILADLSPTDREPSRYDRCWPATRDDVGLGVW